MSPSQLQRTFGYDDWRQMRSAYQARSYKARFKKVIGRYNADGGSLGPLSDAIRHWCRNRVHLERLRRVHDEIARVMSSPKRDQYAPLMAKLTISLPTRPEPSAAEEALVRHFIECQRDVAWRVFKSTVRSSPAPAVTWKPRGLTAMANMAKSWLDNGAELTREAAKLTSDPRVKEIAERAGDHSHLRDVGKRMLARSPIKPRLVSSERSESGEKRLAFRRRVLGATPADLISTAPDIYELGRAGIDGLQGDSATGTEDAAQLLEGEGPIVERLGNVLANPEVLGDQKTFDQVMSAVGMCGAFLGLATGVASEFRATLRLWQAHALEQRGALVPLGSPRSALGGINRLLHRDAEELAAFGALDIGGGLGSVLGGGPLVGIAAFGAKMLLRLKLACRDGSELYKARELLGLGDEQWRTPAFFIEAVKEVPLFGAYFVWGVDKSDMVGFLSDSSRFYMSAFRREVESIDSDYAVIRNIANQTQRRAAWGFRNLTGYQQHLDTRWWKQLEKEAYNARMDFRTANFKSLRGRGKRISSVLRGR